MKNANFKKLKSVAFTGVLVLSATALSQSENPPIHIHHTDHHAHRLEIEPGPALKDTSIYNVGGTWTNQNSDKVKIIELKGKVRVVAMAYSSCQFACPIIVSDMQRIEKGLKPEQKDKVGFVLFSFDPERDTPTTLKAYAEKRGLDLSHWTLLTSNSDQVRELAAVLGVKYRQDDKKDFAHSNMITVLDQDGLIIHQQIGLNREPTETVETINKLLSTAGKK